MTVSEINERILALGNIEGCDVFIMGYSLFNRPIYGCHIGSYIGNQILLQGAIHAREYITALLLIEQVKYTVQKSFNGGFYFLPLMNPDGASIVLEGISSIPCKKTQNFISDVNGGSEDFSTWKADGNAVDLNVNFDADWGQGDLNVFCPAPGNFVGYYPQSERECSELVAFAEKNRPNMTISYHARGEVIYYGFTGQTEQEMATDLGIANALAEVTGYQILRSLGSVGGFKDWTTRVLNVPAFTIEVGNFEMSSPITEEYLPVIYEQNKDVPLTAMQSLENLTIQSKKRRRWQL